MDLQAGAAEIKRAKHLHSVLLFDFIVIHIFVFLIAVSVITTTIIPMILMPLLSIASLGYVLLKARQARTQEPSWFVRSHSLLAAKRARLFLALFLVTGTFTAVMFFGGTKMGFSPIATKALAFGLGQLPFMLSLLVLVVLEFDAEHQCSSGKVPAAAAALCPPPKEA
ncbi:hypothetical protein GALLN_00930 [Gallionellaceae bacterium]|nr:hypothetical protein GALLN_00930 [Gallionellaceae bacterium]